MPPDLPNEQELTLKKRARRRLVGAIALVLLMIIILPQVLQDRALLAQQEPIRITMPETANANPEPVVNNAVVEPAANQQPAPQDVVVAAPVLEVKEPVVATKPESAPPRESLAPQPEKTVAVKTPDVSKTEIKTTVTPAASFTVQVGVYSDVANVKRLQDQLKQAGFSTHTEKIKTPKGESLRLKAGSFNSREDAVVALAKIKELGLSGIVIGND